MDSGERTHLEDFGALWGVYRPNGDTVAPHAGVACLHLLGQSGFRVTVYPGSRSRDIPFEAIDALDVRDAGWTARLGLGGQLRIAWIEETRREAVRLSLLSGREARHRILALAEALRAGVEAQLLLSMVREAEAEDHPLDEWIAQARAIQVARTEDPRWECNWRGILPEEARGFDPAPTETSLYAAARRLREAAREASTQSNEAGGSAEENMLLRAE